MKKIFIASTIFLGLVLVFLLVYNIVFKKQQTPQINTENTVPAKISNNIEEKIITQEKKIKSNITQVLDLKVIGASYDKKMKKIFFYSALDGTAWQIDEMTKNQQQISEDKVEGLKNISWSPDHSKVLTNLSKDGNETFYEFDYKTNKALPLKKGLDTAVWDNLGGKIFYKYFDEKNKSRSLNVANPDGSGWQKLSDISSRNLAIAPVPLTSFVSYWNFPTAKEETVLQIISSVGGAPKTILAGKYGADFLWSPDGTQALVSSLLAGDDKKLTLGTVSINGEYKDLKISTLVSKCVWSNDNKLVYCAMPSDIPTAAVMPDDYLNGKILTKDSFIKIDLATGQQEKIASNEGEYDAVNLFLSADEDALYFTNRIDQKLYKIAF